MHKEQKSITEFLDTVYPCDYQMINGDSLEEITKIEDAKFDLIITSPPYNIGKEYEVKKSIEHYLETQEEIIAQLVRVLSDQGSICWQVGNYVKKGEIFPLDIFYYGIFKKYGLKLRNRIVWHFGHGLHASNRFSGRYETILWFTKSDRIQDLKEGKLKLRPINKPIHTPKPTDKIAQIPEKWENGNLFENTNQK